MANPERNKPCWCGSGKKYKKCHLDTDNAARVSPKGLRGTVELARQRHLAQERIREVQQGLGRPMISAQLNGQKIIAVGNTIYTSDSWKTFPDFLGTYVKRKFGEEWGNAEIAKPFTERHPLLQWYDAYVRHQQTHVEKIGEVHSSPVTGVVACYLGLAYSLYLLDHNVELQERLLKRLRDPGNFQGAYYECMVANALVRAGFQLTLEDETDPSTKHCEFAAVSRETGRKYWVEAKMRAVTGLLGRTADDSSADGKPTSKLVNHLNRAFAKPAADERLIFIDLNAPLAENASYENSPAFVEEANQRLARYKANELPAGEKAYLFITSLDFHRDLDKPPRSIAVPYGIGIPDYNRTGHFRLSELWRRDRVHADANRIADALTTLHVFPSTFDGSLPSEGLAGAQRRLMIGETYHFDKVDGPDGVTGKVSSAAVVEAESCAYVSITTADGRGLIVKSPMTEDDLAEYRQHPDAYFGVLQSVSTKAETPYDMFKFFMRSYATLPCDELLKRLAKLPASELEGKSHEELLALHAEGLCASLPGPPGSNVVRGPSVLPRGS